MYNILYTVSTQHQYDDIMYAIGYTVTTCFDLNGHHQADKEHFVKVQKVVLNGIPFRLQWNIKLCIKNSYLQFIHSLVFSPRGRSGRSQSPVMEPIWFLAHCILGKFLGVFCRCFPPPLDFPTFAATCLCVRSDARDPSSERWNCGREKCPVVILPKFRLPRKFRDLLLAVNLRHGTDGFTSPPKEGVLRGFLFTIKTLKLSIKYIRLKSSKCFVVVGLNQHGI